jgi:hypothetical protein
MLLPVNAENHGLQLGSCSQIIDMPAQWLVSLGMPTYPGTQSSRAEGTADIKVKTAPQLQTSKPANIYPAF